MFFAYICNVKKIEIIKFDIMSWKFNLLKEKTIYIKTEKTKIKKSKCHYYINLHVP